MLTTSSVTAGLDTSTADGSHAVTGENATKPGRASHDTSSARTFRALQSDRSESRMGTWNRRAISDVRHPAMIRNACITGTCVTRIGAEWTQLHSRYF
jgi:hypothetical protein